MSAAIKAQIEALGALLESVAAQLDSLKALVLDPAPERTEASECEHPEDKRRPMGTMGENANRYLCGACGETVTP